MLRRRGSRLCVRPDRHIGQRNRTNTPAKNNAGTGTEDNAIKIIAVANQKGGVGKTTVTRELSACFALRGYQTLVIDCDPQGNLSKSWLGEDTDTNQIETLSHVIVEATGADGKRMEPLPLTDAVVETTIETLDLVTADIRLARFEMEPEYMMHRLSNQIQELPHYDLVFLDCPPQLGKLLSTALYAADYVLIPCAADSMGLQGLADLAYTIDQIKKNVNNKLQLLGAVMNLYKVSRRLSALSRSEVETSLPAELVFDTNLHDYAKFAEAPSQQMAVVQYAPNHKATEQMESLTDEVLNRLKMPRQRMELVKSTK